MIKTSYIIVFMFNLRYILLQDNKHLYVYVYNKNYVLCFRIFKRTTTINVCNQYFLKLNLSRFKCLEQNFQLEYIFNNILKQFCIYESLKIKFTGKGYKIKKVSTNSIVFVFNRAHLVLLYYKNIFFKKIKKRKIHIKYISFSLRNQIIPILKNIRYINTYTRRGLRISRQIIYKRRGKRT